MIQISKKLFFVSLICVFGVGGLFAQPQNPGGDPDNPIPIGGLELLLIGGGVLGLRKIIASQKKN